MRKIWVTTSFALFLFLFFSSYAKAEGTAELIEKYLHDDKSCGGMVDCVSPFYYKIARNGAEAVQPLLEALNNQDSLYVGYRSAFFCLLGMIGDARAYSGLRAIFLENKKYENKWYEEGEKWRLAISLGACLGEESIDDFVALVVRDATGGALRAIRGMSGQDFGENEEQWVEYLKTEGHLEVFRTECRKGSAPILG